MLSDKWLHALCGYAITITAGMFIPWLGALSGVLAAFVKEFIWDKWLKKGMFEWADINATLVGILIGFCLTFFRCNI